MTALATDGVVLYSASWDGLLSCRLLSTGAPSPSWTCDAGVVLSGCAPTSLALCPRGGRLYVGCSDGGIRCLRSSDGALLFAMAPGEGHGSGAVSGLSVCPLGETLLSVGVCRHLSSWRLAPPAEWHASASHVRFPAPFKAAVRELALCASAQGSAVGDALGCLDPATRGGLLQHIAALLAQDVYAVDAM